MQASNRPVLERGAALDHLGREKSEADEPIPLQLEVALYGEFL